MGIPYEGYSDDLSDCLPMEAQWIGMGLWGAGRVTVLAGPQGDKLYEWVGNPSLTEVREVCQKIMNEGGR